MSLGLGQLFLTELVQLQLQVLGAGQAAVQFLLQAVLLLLQGGDLAGQVLVSAGHLVPVLGALGHLVHTALQVGHLTVGGDEGLLFLVQPVTQHADVLLEVQLLGQQLFLPQAVVVQIVAESVVLEGEVGRGPEAEHGEHDQGGGAGIGTELVLQCSGPFSSHDGVHVLMRYKAPTTT